LFFGIERNCGTNFESIGVDPGTPRKGDANHDIQPVGDSGDVMQRCSNLNSQAEKRTVFLGA
jgi:hypothetical protein